MLAVVQLERPNTRACHIYSNVMRSLKLHDNENFSYGFTFPGPNLFAHARDSQELGYAWIFSVYLIVVFRCIPVYCIKNCKWRTIVQGARLAERRFVIGAPPIVLITNAPEKILQFTIGALLITYRALLGAIKERRFN